MDKVDLYGLLKREIIELISQMGEKPFRATQLFEWMYKKRVESFDQMTNIPKVTRQALSEVAELGRVTIASRAVAREGTRKYLIRLEDGQGVESVLIPHDFGYSICVSSQAGCRMACDFCASAEGGFVRNLTAGEITGQVLVVQRDSISARISRVDFMGSGEPLDNYDNVLKAIRIMQDPDGLGIGARRITISTCGLVPGIKRLASEGLQVTLSLSLHASNNELRSRLMPINRRYPLEEVIAACDEYAFRTGRRVTYEYALIDGVNDSVENARELARLVKGKLAHVNLIPLNYVPGRPYARSDPKCIARFVAELKRHGVKVTRRREMGSGIDAACGQLRRREMDAALRQVRERPVKGGQPG